MARQDEQSYTYEEAGYDPFLTRSIDGGSSVSSEGEGSSRQLNLEQSQISGQLGDSITVGNISINGNEERISVFDGDGNEVVRIGRL